MSIAVNRPRMRVFFDGTPGEVVHSSLISLPHSGQLALFGGRNDKS